jgi:myo-inositol-1(or 4)-monophosphatase
MAPSADEWLGACRRATAGVREMLAGWSTTAQRAVQTGRGEGGDNALVIDRAAEDVIFAELDALRAGGARFMAVSEERGEVDYGDPGVRVVIDPIDGSLNAKRTMPPHAFSLAVARGATMADVEVAYVYDFGTEEEWTATRGEGAFLDGRVLDGDRPKERIEILAFEATRTVSVAEKAAAVVDLAYRLRIMGSLALSLCHLAAGRIDAVCSLKPARSVDIAAAQLLVRERGLAIDLFEDPPFEAAPLDVEGRSRVVAAGTPQLCQQLATALSA